METEPAICAHLECNRLAGETSALCPQCEAQLHPSDNSCSCSACDSDAEDYL